LKREPVPTPSTAPEPPVVPAKCENVYGSSLTAMIREDELVQPDAIAVTDSVMGLELRAEKVIDLADALPVIVPPVIVQLYVAPGPASGIDAAFPEERPCTVAGEVIVVTGAVSSVIGISLEIVAVPQAGTTVRTTYRVPVPPPRSWPLTT